MVVIFLIMAAAIAMSIAATYLHYKTEELFLHRYCLESYLINNKPTSSLALIDVTIDAFKKRMDNLNSSWFLICVEGILVTFAIGCMGILVAATMPSPSGASDNGIPWYVVSSYFSLVSSGVILLGAYMESYAQRKRLSRLVHELYTVTMFVDSKGILH